MKKRIFAALTAAAMTLAMLSSCDVQTPTEGSETAAINPTDTIAAETSAETKLPEGFRPVVTEAVPPIVQNEYVDYATALQDALYFYDANMCGTKVGEHSALDWRDDCHTFDTYEYNGQQIDLTGGFHDAGDHVKFGLPAAYSAFVLGYSYHTFPEAFVDTKQDAHLQTITDHFADYFRKCAIYEDGKVVAFCYQVGTGGGDYDHGYWGSPEEQPQVNEKTGNARIAYFTDEKNLNADIVSATIAALAINYLNFGNEEDLKVAQDLHAWLEQYTDIIVADESDNEDDLEIVSTVPQYARWENSAWKNTPWDYLTLGEYSLNLATGTSDYTTILEKKIEAMPTFYKSYGATPFPANWDGVWPYSNLVAGELGDKTILSMVQSYNMGTNVGQYINFKSPQTFCFVQEWGSARINCNFQFTGLAYERITPEDDSFYANWATYQMDYLFGNNPNKQAFVIGYNYRDDVKYPKYPHHRASSSPAYGGSVTGNGTKEQSHILVGALVGGPGDKDGTYEDSAENYTLNEVGLDYNAGFVGALAGLYCAYSNSGTDTIVNPPSQIAVGVEDTYAY
jgi:hypothetical protein